MNGKCPLCKKRMITDTVQYYGLNMHKGCYNRYIKGKMISVYPIVVSKFEEKRESLEFMLDKPCMVLLETDTGRFVVVRSLDDDDLTNEKFMESFFPTDLATIDEVNSGKLQKPKYKKRDLVYWENIHKPVDEILDSFILENKENIMKLISDDNV